MTRILLYLLLFIIFLSISASSIIILLSGADSIGCAFWRLCFTVIILLTYSLLFRKSLLKTFVNDVFINKYGFFAGLSLAAHFLLWMESLYHIPVAISTTIVVSYPLFALVIDRFVYSEKITILQYLGILFGFIGLTMFLYRGFVGDINLYGVLLSLFGSIAATSYFCIGRYVRLRRDLMEYVFPTYFYALLGVLFYSLVIGKNILAYSPKSYFFFILLAIVPMLGGHTLMNYILKYMKSSVVTSIALTEPIGASILAYLILGQVIGLYEVIPMAIVLTSIIIVIREELRIRKEVIT